MLVSVFGYGASSRSILLKFIKPIMTAIFYILYLCVYVFMYTPHTHTQTNTNTRTHTHTHSHTHAHTQGKSAVSIMPGVIEPILNIIKGIFVIPGAGLCIFLLFWCVVKLILCIMIE